jgi:nicotinamide-nucleotide amidase
MRAYILSIGSELIHGHLTDTNATFLAQEMVATGIELLHVVQVGDDLDRLSGALRAAVAEADLVVCTGGVGPTDDDLTREAIAAVVGEEPAVDPTLLETVRGFFVSRGIDMPERNAKQAWLIPSAEPLPNPVGTAPGWFVRRDASVVVAMPGVPREMVRMWKEQALPRLASLLPRRSYRSTNIRTLGIGESSVSEALADLTKSENPYVGTYAKDDGVHVRVTASAPTDGEAEELLAEGLHEIRVRLADWIYAEDERSLAAVLLDHLRVGGRSVGVAEAGTGGRFAGLLFGEPLAGDVVRGAEIVADGTGDARGLAREAASRFGAALGVGLVALVSPIGNGLFEGSVEVGLTGAIEANERFPIRAAYAEVQRRAAMHAADVLRRAVLAADDAPAP